jgi:glutamate racemase
VRRLLVFDSGIGGLSVVREIRQSMPGAQIIYVADDVGFPYGEWEAVALSNHVVTVIEGLVDRFSPDAVVIACNTASTLVLPALRERIAVPFVGTVPAIKPAAARTITGLVSVLATFGTMQRDYTRDLIQSFARSCDVRLVGSNRLAPLAEDHISGLPINEEDVRSEIATAFVEKDTRRTDTIVLACTHYPFLIEAFRRLAPWPVNWIDPAEAIARRVVAVVGSAVQSQAKVEGFALLTSEKSWPLASRPLLNALGLNPGRMNIVLRDPI